MVVALRRLHARHPGTRSLGEVDQPPAHGDGDRVRPVRGAELAQQGVHVVPHGVLADPEPGTDRGIAPARGQGTQDLELPSGQRVRRAGDCCLGELLFSLFL